MSGGKDKDGRCRCIYYNGILCWNSSENADEIYDEASESDHALYVERLSINTNNE